MTTEQEEHPTDVFEGGPGGLDPIDWSQWSTTPPHLQPQNGEGQGEDPPQGALSPESLNAAVNQQMEGARPEVPIVGEPPNGTVELLWGIERDGKRYRTALVRELNGADEERIARLSTSATNYNVLVVDLHLRCAVEQVGPVLISDEPDLLGELLISDRDILFKEILLATYGKTRDYENVPCPTCSFEMDLHIDIEALIQVTKAREFDSNQFVVILRNGTQVLMRNVTGNDQLSVFRNTSRALSTPEANTAFIAACVDKVDGKPIADPEKWARELGILDRTKIVNALLDIPAIGFKEVEVPCTKCGKNLPTVFGWADLLPG